MTLEIDPLLILLLLLGLFLSVISYKVSQKYTCFDSITRNRLWYSLPILIGLLWAAFYYRFPLTDIEQLITFTLAVTVTSLWLATLLHDSLFWYNESHAPAPRTKTRTMWAPILIIFAPTITYTIAILIILDIWGINLYNVLFTGGVIGLILGFALQDSLSNIFSGVILRTEPSFQVGDIVALKDGKVCKVEKIWHRVTELYSISEHSFVYVPNNIMVNETVTNLTKPTLDLRVSLPISLEHPGKIDDTHIRQITEILQGIAKDHPNVLFSDLEKKREFLGDNNNKFVNYPDIKNEIDHKKKTIAKEIELDNALMELIKKVEVNEKIPDKDKFFDEEEKVKEKMKVWTESWYLRENKNEKPEEEGKSQEIIEDHVRNWNSDENWKLQEGQKERIFYKLVEQYRNTKQAIQGIEDKIKRILKEEGELQNIKEKKSKIDKKKDDLKDKREAKEKEKTECETNFINWVMKYYKPRYEDWKDPKVFFDSFSRSSVNLIFQFHVDDITLNKGHQKEIVITQIANEIQHQFNKSNVKMTYLHTDINLVTPKASPYS